MLQCMPTAWYLLKPVTTWNCYFMFPKYTCLIKLGLSSATELHLCPQMCLDTHLHLSTAQLSIGIGTSPGSEQPFFPDLQTDQISKRSSDNRDTAAIKSYYTAVNRCDPFLPCNSNRFLKNLSLIKLGCSNTASLPGEGAVSFPFNSTEPATWKFQRIESLPPLPPAPQGDEFCIPTSRKHCSRLSSAIDLLTKPGKTKPFPRLNCQDNPFPDALTVFGYSSSIT